MNILIINHHGSIDKYGSNSRHFSIGKYLSNKGHNVLLIASSYNHLKHEYIHEESIKYDTVNQRFGFLSIKTKPNYKGNTLRFINYLDFAIKSNFIKPNFSPDIIVGSSVHPFTWISAYKLSKYYNADFHVEIRDIWPLSLYEELPSIIRAPLFKISQLYERFYYNKAKSIIVTAPLASKYLSENFHIESSKINYVPHGIDISNFDEHKYSKPEGVNLEKKFNVTYTGALSTSEGLENLLSLAENYKNNESIHFNIFGGGNQKSILLNIVNEKNLKNVTFHGLVTSDTIPWILNNSDVLWCGLKSRKVFEYSISKNKFYDYMASEKPIIFHSDVKNTPLEESKSSFIIPLDELSVEKLNLLINDNILRNKMGRSGREYVEKNHDISIVSEKFVSHF